MDLLVSLLIFCIASSNIVFGDGQSTFDLINFGAIGDGTTDDTQAFAKAWKVLCGATNQKGIPTLKIPTNHTFLLNRMEFRGPCKSNSIHIQISGTIVAPSSISAWGGCGKTKGWLGFYYVEGLILEGSGKIDGQGLIWWENKSCKGPQRALEFHHCNNLHLSDLTHINSPRVHIEVRGSIGVFISHLHIFAPKTSSNTDGIDIARSSQVQIQNSIIQTGDDCIAMLSGCSNINITNITCGPGHGISIGSLGKIIGKYDTAEEIHVRNCSFNGTSNGARIKTWQGGSGYVRKISFEQITLIASDNPIIIDQYYGNRHGIKNTSAVLVSDITYNGFHGTTTNEEAIRLDCSDMGCKNIIMDQVNITSSDPSKKTHAYCKSATGTSKATTPEVDCLSKVGYS